MTNRISQIDATCHLNVLINNSIFDKYQVAENAQIILKFVLWAKKQNKNQSHALRDSEMNQVGKMAQGYFSTKNVNAPLV